MNKGLTVLLKKMALTIWAVICSCCIGWAQTWMCVGSPDFSLAQYTSIAISRSGTPYVAFRDGNEEASVMTYSGSGWAPVGSSGFSGAEVGYIDIAMDTGGTPYVVFTGVKATVMKYYGGAWVNVGSPEFTDSDVSFTSIGIDSGGTPYVAYVDGTDSYKVTVMKYDGAGWVTVGSRGFSAGEAENTTIAIAPNGTPYVAYQDVANSRAVTVMSYNGASWVPVGSPAFTTPQAYSPAIAISNSGTPYVVYSDDSDDGSGQASVKYFNGSSWEYVGSPRFSAGLVLYTVIAIGQDGVPYVAYQDESSGPLPLGATVMRYDRANWVALGNQEFSPGEARYLSIAIDPVTAAPYVALSSGPLYHDSATVMTPGAVSGIKKINEDSASSLEVFPNPSNGSFTLRLSTVADEDARVIITDAIGNKVYESALPANRDSHVQFSSLPGTFFITAIQNNNNITKMAIIN